MASTSALSARESAHAFLTALADRDCSTVAAFLDPDALHDFHQHALHALAAALQRQALQRETGERLYCLRPSDLDDPAFITRFGASPVNVLPGAPTLATLAALSAPAFFARVLGANIGALPPFRLANGLPAFTILGEVPENESLVHVLYRQDLGKSTHLDDEEAIQRLTLRLCDTGWFVDLNCSLQALARVRTEALSANPA